jgi:hypothetical protein
MGKLEYDFREGLDGTKRVYHDDRWCNCVEFWGYIGYLLATWCWMAGWFALFLHAWLEDRVVTFWVFVGVWFGFLIFLIGGFMIPNLCKYYSARAERRRLKEEARLAKEKNLPAQTTEKKEDNVNVKPVDKKDPNTIVLNDKPEENEKIKNEQKDPESELNQNDEKKVANAN